MYLLSSPIPKESQKVTRTMINFGSKFNVIILAYIKQLDLKI